MSFPGLKLSINLGAIQANWQLIHQDIAPESDVSAVVKANGYGLGAPKIAPALWQAGARNFFVALPDEGAELRQILPQAAQIYILGGLWPGATGYYLEHRLIPVLNSQKMCDQWLTDLAKFQQQAPCVIQTETGMNRLGLSETEFANLLAQADNPLLTPTYLMSHLACADDPAHKLNQAQISCFQTQYQQIRSCFPRIKASLSNSAGLFLPQNPHYDLIRPGIALYGGTPSTSADAPRFHFPLTLSAQILQIRSIDRPGTVGYGATSHIGKGQKLAVIAVGYADGYLRYLSNRGFVQIGSYRAPIVGRVSMDVTTVDVSHIPDSVLSQSQWADILSPMLNATDLAEQAGTIDYEILTSLGHRAARDYLD